MNHTTIDRANEWPALERMAMLQCVCYKPEDWQQRKVEANLCARCAYIIRPLIDRGDQR